MFRKAIPVWEKGKETEMNWFLRFTAQVPREGTIRIAAGSAYRVFVDGGFLCAGPARAAHGFSRVDEVPYRCEGQGMCAIAVEAGSYCCNSFEYLDEPGFLQCEVESGGEIAAATGCFGFTAERMTEKTQRVERYSFQRAFCEEYDLTGKSEIERCFLENYLLPERFPHIPEGMVPMCYPADHTDGVFIPNWAMWLVLELAEYLERSGDRELVGRFRPRVYGLIRYFDRFLNGDGLLEKLESWVFVEWSKANDLVQDVNYPSNMLYAKMLDCAGALYGDEALRERSRAMQETIRAQSFDGAFFRDHAVRRDGRLSVEPERTETCQYYAFFCGTARREDGRFAGLWRTLTEDFGPQRRQTGAHPDVFFSNAFIGNYLRLELLYRAGLFGSLRREIAGYFASMAERTGTLWEHDSPTASCCHGFASHVVCWLDGIASGA